MASFFMGRQIKKIGRKETDAQCVFTQFLLVSVPSALYTLYYDERIFTRI